MLVVTPLTVYAATYFLAGPAPGTWAGEGSRALGLEGGVQARELRRVLAGRDPVSGHPLPLRRVAHRRAGWDLTFAAPKSLSLLAALASTADGAAIAQAHEAAVGDAMAWLTTHGCRARLGGRLEATEGIVQARYEHRSSEAGDPHLHSHVLLANLARTTGSRWSALAGSPLWPAMRPLGGVYRLALRGRLIEAGLDLRWRTIGPPSSPAGSLIDVEEVPASAVAAASHRHREVAAALGGWDEPDMAGRAARRAVRAASRGATAAAGQDAGEGWSSRVAAAGFGPAEASEVCVSAHGRATHPTPEVAPPGLEATVTDWLRQRASTFTALDVVRALGATHSGGMAPSDVDRWVERFCASPDPYAGRWTTPAADQDAAAVVVAARQHRSAAHVPGGHVIDSAVRMHRLDRVAAAEARRILAGVEGVTVLAGAPGTSRLIQQAAILAAARSAWEASGHEVGLLAPAAALRRWDALSALRPPGRGPAPAVLVVDRADRRPSPELRGLVERAAACGARLVLVEGGTLPARHHPASGALAELLGTRVPEHSPDRAARAPACAVTVAAPPLPACSVGTSTFDAIGSLVDRWLATPRDNRPMLVGLGPAEVEALNAEARARMAARGELEGPALQAGGREYQVGDRVMALRSLGAAASGTYGTIVAVDLRRKDLTIAWSGRAAWSARTATVDRHDARRLGHGYASMPSRVPPIGREVLLLGDARALRHRRAAVVGTALVAPTARRPAPEALDLLAARQPPPGAATVAAWAAHDLAVLDRDRRRLAARLMAAAPPDPAAAARLAAEQSRWTRAAPDGSRTDGSRTDGSRTDEVSRWVQAHGGDLAAWRLLGEAMGLRGDALARAAEIEPGLRRLGLPARGREPDVGLGPPTRVPADVGLGFG